MSLLYNHTYISMLSSWMLTHFKHATFSAGPFTHQTSHMETQSWTPGQKKGQEVTAREGGTDLYQQQTCLDQLKTIMELHTHCTDLTVEASSLAHEEEPSHLPYAVRIALLWPSTYSYAQQLSTEGLRQAERTVKTAIKTSPEGNSTAMFWKWNPFPNSSLRHN